MILNKQDIISQVNTHTAINALLAKFPMEIKPCKRIFKNVEQGSEESIKGMREKYINSKDTQNILGEVHYFQRWRWLPTLAGPSSKYTEESRGDKKGNFHHITAVNIGEN